MSARRTREIARERQCNWCKKYSFDALRCAACKAVYCCDGECQRKDWRAGGHRLVCVTQGLEDLVSSEIKAKRSGKGRPRGFLT